MRTSQLGDRVRVHYVQTFQDGSVRSSREGGEPLEVIVGTDHTRLPGLGLGLLGLVEGQAVTFDIPAERAYGVTDMNRIKCVTRERFSADEDVTPGRRTRMRLSRGRTRSVRVVEISENGVIVDLNHPRSGQSVHLEIEVVAILESNAEAGHWRV